MQRKTTNSWADDNEDEEKESHILNYGFLWSKAATSLQRCVWMRRRSQEWWDRDVNGFTETDFIQNFRMSRGTFNYICQHLSSRLSLQDAQFRQPVSLLAVCMHVWCEFWYDRSDWGHIAKYQTCIWFRTTYESGPNLNWKDQIPCDLCCLHCSENIRSESHMSKKSLRLPNSQKQKHHLTAPPIHTPVPTDLICSLVARPSPPTPSSASNFLVRPTGTLPAHSHSVSQFVPVAMGVSCVVLLCSSFCFLNVNSDLHSSTCQSFMCLSACISAFLYLPVSSFCH